MSRRTGPPRTPSERARRLGNPGHRSLPPLDNLVLLPPATTVPQPRRPLGPAGRAFWDYAWSLGAAWVASTTDNELLLILAEQQDERGALRLRVLRDGNRFDRAALRELDRQIVDGLAQLGFTPAERARLGMAEVARVSKLDALRRKAK